MTCIIGMVYDQGRGALIISDSRIMRGGDYATEQKVFVMDNVAFASSGYSGMAEKLRDNFEAARRTSRQILPKESVAILEDEMAKLYERYKTTRPYRFSSDDTLLTGMLGFVEDETPKLYCLHENGYAEGVHSFLAIGHGARHALNVIKALYDSKIKQQRALEVAIHALVQVSEVDAMVDRWPQVAILEKGKGEDGIEFLNGAGTDFAIDCPAIAKITRRLVGLEERRTKLFHELLDGQVEIIETPEAVKEEHDGQRQNGRGKRPSPGAGGRKAPMA